MNALVAPHRLSEPVAAKVEVVSPAIAKLYLQFNTANRPVKKSHVKFLSGAMSRGEWTLNGESIKFDADGNLIDGQHRLLALVAAGCSVPMLVVRNLPSESFSTIDTGVARGGGDVLALTGHALPNHLSAAVKFVIAHEIKGVMWGEGSGTANVSNRQVLDAINRHPGLEPWVVKSHAARFISPSTILAAACYLSSSRSNGHLVDAFLDKFISGANLEEESPVYQLRERLIAARNGQNRFTRKEIAALTVKAINAFRAGRSIKRITWVPARESFPEIDL